MTVCELKEKLKTLGKTTKTRKKEKKNTSCIGKGNRKQHLKLCSIYLNGPRRKKPVCEGYANIKGADKSAHLRSLVSAVAVHLLGSIISYLASSEISLFYRVFVAEQALNPCAIDHKTNIP